MKGSNESLVQGGSFFLPPSISSAADGVDQIFNFVLYGSMFLFFGIFAFYVFVIIRFRRKRSDQLAEFQFVHSTFLEVLWTAIPLILVMYVAVWGTQIFLRQNICPPGAIQVRVEARKWSWSFTHIKQGLQTMDKLVVPVNQPVRLIMASVDVLHSLYIPNLRVKKDVLPNRYSVMWFRAEREGKFQIFCTEYCGDKHSYMLADLIVVSDQEYSLWMQQSITESQKSLSPAQLGEKAFRQYCVSCHTVDGTKGVGPSFKGLFGGKRDLSGGSSAIADENYIRESILYPAKKVVAGFANQMPSFMGILQDDQINGLIDYIKELSQ